MLSTQECLASVDRKIESVRFEISETKCCDSSLFIVCKGGCQFIDHRRIFTPVNRFFIQLICNACHSLSCRKRHVKALCCCCMILQPVTVTKSRLNPDLLRGICVGSVYGSKLQSHRCLPGIRICLNVGDKAGLMNVDRDLSNNTVPVGLSVR